MERRLPNPRRAWWTIFAPLLVATLLVVVAMVGVVESPTPVLARGAAVVVAYAALGLMVVTVGVLAGLVYINWRVWRAWPRLAHTLWRWQQQAEAAPSMVRQLAYRIAKLIIAPRAFAARVRAGLRVLRQLAPRPRLRGGRG
ncbi:MAG: hypothetical protein GXO36_02585 [Chloroflexi bacterium]|nr:hypothetical protein [Chloroflexota bacterium]